jgi:uncharacterized protein YndB with AHSA1/START domain
MEYEVFIVSVVEKTDDGRFVLRFERRLAHRPAKVWRAITETEQLRGWFVQMLDYDKSTLHFVEGASLSYFPTGSGLPTDHGRVLRADPPRLLEYTWGAETLRWELEPDGDTACRLTFTNILDDPDTAGAVAPGWQAALDGLATVLDGRTAERHAGARD